MIHYAETKYGFEYGSITIERCCSDEKKKWVVLMLKTNKYPNGIQIYATKTGKVRISNYGGKEWKEGEG